jgi:triphosphatase
MNSLPVRAKSIRLSKHMTVEQAFRKVIRNCLRQIEANKDAVVDRQDSESLHQMRVGLRRLNSAFDLFKDFIQVPDDLRQELDWLSRQLGNARDWDVLSNSTLPRITEILPRQMRLAGIKAAIAAKVEDKYAAAANAVKSGRYTRLMRRLSLWLEGEDWRDAMLPENRKQLARQIPGLARDRLSHARRRLLKQGKNLHGATPAVRHKVRIAAKKTRYAVEFFQSLLSKKPTKRYVKSLSHLQDELGWLNDMAVAGRLLRDLGSERIDLQGRAEFVRGYLMGCAEEHGEKVEGLWKKFRRFDLPA